MGGAQLLTASPDLFGVEPYNLRLIGVFSVRNGKLLCIWANISAGIVAAESAHVCFHDRRRDGGVSLHTGAELNVGIRGAFFHRRYVRWCATSARVSSLDPLWLGICKTVPCLKYRLAARRRLRPCCLDGLRPGRRDGLGSRTPGIAGERDSIPQQRLDSVESGSNMGRISRRFRRRF